MPYFHHFVSDSPSVSSNGHNNASYSSSANSGYTANGAANQQRSDVNGKTTVKNVQAGAATCTEDFVKCLRDLGLSSSTAAARLPKQRVELLRIHFTKPS